MIKGLPKEWLSKDALASVAQDSVPRVSSIASRADDTVWFLSMLGVGRLYALKFVDKRTRVYCVEAFVHAVIALLSPLSPAVCRANPLS